MGTLSRFSAIPADFLQHSADFLQYLQIFCNVLQNFYRASSNDINRCTAQRSSVALFPFSSRLPQLQKESTTCILCHINAVTVKSHLLVLVVEDITKGILVGSDLKLVKTSFLWWTSLHHQQNHERILQRFFQRFIIATGVARWILRHERRWCAISQRDSWDKQSQVVASKGWFIGVRRSDGGGR